MDMNLAKFNTYICLSKRTGGKMLAIRTWQFWIYSKTILYKYEHKQWQLGKQILRTINLDLKQDLINTLFHKKSLKKNDANTNLTIALFVYSKIDNIMNTSTNTKNVNLVQLDLHTRDIIIGLTMLGVKQN